jgi:hypothetical protein
LPDLEFSKSAVLNSLTSVDGQRGYAHAIDEFVDWYCSEPRLALNRTVVLRYPRYWVNNKQVTKREYLRACANHANLPPFRESDNQPRRKFPPEVLAAMNRTS